MARRHAITAGPLRAVFLGFQPFGAWAFLSFRSACDALAGPRARGGTKPCRYAKGAAPKGGAFCVSLIGRALRYSLATMSGSPTLTSGRLSMRVLDSPTWRTLENASGVNSTMLTMSS